jgi:outer membrane protein assembly factor BamB
MISFAHLGREPLMTTSVSPNPRRRFGDWVGPAAVAVIWSISLAGWLLDIQSFAWFLVTFAISMAMTLLFLGWWFTRRSFTWGQRFLVFAVAFGMGILIRLLSFHTIVQPAYLLFFALPVVLTVWAVWVLATRGRETRARSAGLIAFLVLAWSAFLLVRVPGFQGNLRADVHWRWTPTSEEMYLAQRHAEMTAPATQPIGRPLELRPGDWPGFRGPGRDSVVHHLRINLDWSQSPPKVLWRQRVGPAWSSMAVVDGCLFTQEQRSEREAVVCRDALTGSQIWAHDEPGRFEEAMSGVGPRATPVFANGRIYAQGALGTLNCLDASTGRVIWSRDVHADASAALPLWAFCNSPLVMDDRVIVYAGGEGKKGLLAYSVEGGTPLWTADAGKVSYASPQALDLGAERDVLIFTNEGVFAVDPATGQTRWQFPLESRVGLPASIQACQVGPDSLVLGNGAAFGAQRIRVAPDHRSATRQWLTPRMKPSFSDMVYHDGFLYGFDGTVFCCVDANNGNRLWRDGRYGAGQVVLLAEQGVMIVSSEGGQVILLRCNSQHNEELGRIPAITGKAWNHPAIAQDRLYVRSDGEMACLQLTTIDSR